MYDMPMRIHKDVVLSMMLLWMIRMDLSKRTLMVYSSYWVCPTPVVPGLSNVDTRDLRSHGLLGRRLTSLDSRVFLDTKFRKDRIFVLEKMPSWMSLFTVSSAGI